MQETHPRAVAEWLTRLRVLNLRAPISAEPWSPIDISAHLLGCDRGSLSVMRSYVDEARGMKLAAVALRPGVEAPSFPPLAAVVQRNLPSSVHAIKCGGCHSIVASPSDAPLLPPLGVDPHGDDGACGCPRFSFEENIEDMLRSHASVMHWSPDRLGVLACLPTNAEGNVVCIGCGRLLGSRVDIDNSEDAVPFVRLSAMEVVLSAAGRTDAVVEDVEHRLASWLAWVADAGVQNVVALPGMELRIVASPSFCAEWTLFDAHWAEQTSLKPAISVMFSECETVDPDVPLHADDVALLRARLTARATPTPTGKPLSFLFCQP